MGELCQVFVASLVAVQGLGCPVAGEIIVPGAEIEPAFAALEGEFFTCGPPGKPPYPTFYRDSLPD